MIEDDRSYYRRRAEFELELAQAAVSPAAVAAHHKLAEAYLDRAGVAPEPAKRA